MKNNTPTKQTPVPTKARGAAKINATQAKLASNGASPAKTKITRVQKAPSVHSCEAVGIHARGLCKGCYRKQRLELKKSGLTFATRDQKLAAPKRAKKAATPAPTPIAARQVDKTPAKVEFIKKTRKSA